MFANYAAAVASGTTITCALFYVMQSLIAMQPGIVVDTRDRVGIIWLNEKIPDEPPIVEQPIIDRPEFEHPPLTPRPTSGDDGVTAIHFPKTPTAIPEPDRFDTLQGFSDGPPVSIMNVRPVYPAGAVAKGLEGFVDVQFDVLANGLVANLRVVDSSHRVFEKAALNAAGRFRYKPRVVDGEAQVSSGVRYRFRFEMEH